MPTRGYRKGMSDRKVPVPRFVRSRISEAMFARLEAEAEARSLTYSRLLYEILRAHQAGMRLEAPQGRTAQAGTLRELCRIGNNLNQIARQAHVMRLHLIQQEAEDVLAELVAVVRRM